MLKLLKYPVIDCAPPKTSETLFDDMQLSGVFDRRLQRPVRYLTTEPEAIRERNAVLRDLIDGSSFFDAFSKFRDAAADMQYVARMPDSDPMRILGSLTSFRSVWEAGTALLGQLDRRRSYDYASFKAELKAFLDRCYVPNFEEEWNARAYDIERIESVTYDLWFDSDLHIREVALNGVSGENFKRPRMPWGKTDLANMEIRGLAPLTADDRFGDMRGRHYDPAHDASAMQRVQRLVNGLLPTVTTDARQSVFSTFSRMTSELNELKNELDFLITGAEIINELTKKGLKFTFAQIAPQSERRLTAEAIYHPVLAQQENIGLKKNDVAADDSLILLGGQNRGGKTVYLRSIGTMQIFFQMGLPVPAKSAVLSPAPAILCVFTREEEKMLSFGKIGRELSDVRDAAELSCEDALVLFNEPITATSPIECRLLSRETLCMLKVKRSRGVWVTHIYPLFDDAEDMNENLPGTGMIFMHANPPDSKYDRFAILPGRPDADSGARYILNE